MKTQICKTCKEIKAHNLFARHLNSRLRPYCLSCWQRDTPQKIQEKFTELKELRRLADRDYHRSHLEESMLGGARRRAQKNGLPFSLKIEDIKIPDTCPVLGIKLQPSERKTGNCSPSIDKIVPSLGYTKENIRIISWRANSIKRDATVEELEKITEYVKKNTLENSCHPVSEPIR